MKRDNIFRLVERRLFHYAENIALIADLKAELEDLRTKGDIHGVEYKQAFSGHSEPSDPVANQVNRVLAVEKKIARIESYVLPINKFIQDIGVSGGALARDFLMLFRLFYLDRHEIKDIAAIIEKSRRTIYNRRRELVKTVARYFGLEL